MDVPNRPPDRVLYGELEETGRHEEKHLIAVSSSLFTVLDYQEVIFPRIHWGRKKYEYWNLPDGRKIGRWTWE